MNNYKQWIALEQAKGLGIQALKEIHKTISSLNISICDLFECTAEEISSEFNFSAHILDGILEAKKKLPEIDTVYCDLIDANIQPILFFESTYPERLLNKLKSNAPAILYAIGNTELLNTSSAALLGTSEISEKGKAICNMTSKLLCDNEITIISGMSKGTGTIAHRSAIENNGNTVAVLPCGVFSFKMSEQLQTLYNPDHFLIISPYFPNEEFNKYNAFKRNRLIGALAEVVYIVEATEEDGIIEAAKSAIKLEIPLFTTKYAEYPASALGNLSLINQYNAAEIQGKKVNGTLVPNLDKMISQIKTD
jgi:predicted Rossmann fold nucleotide-binding protein DprA/Smf involved in DNA uptake